MIYLISKVNKKCVFILSKKRFISLPYILYFVLIKSQIVLIVSH